MEAKRFDRWTLTFSRRTLVGALALPELGEARKKRKRRRNKQKVKRNSVGCVDVGKFCQSSEQCCSGICEGKKGKKTCQAHDQSTCQAGQPSGPCADADIACTTSSGDEGFCNTTTGNAGYCASAGGCFACTRDTDCIEPCGLGAACVPCASECGHTGGTACFGLDVCQV